MTDPAEILRLVREENATKNNILDPRDPMTIARKLVAAQFSADKSRLLHHHRGSFWLWNSNHYAPAASEIVRKAAWTYMENAHRIVDKKPVPFKPKSAIVSDVIDALSA